MHLQNRSSFSPDNKYFACISGDENLLIWEILSNVFIECKFDSNVYNTCSSLHWILSQPKYNAPKKAKFSRNNPVHNNLLAVGTVKGDILIYNIESKNLFLHLVGRHSDAVNDMSFYAETNSLYTCSSDKYIGIWDISSGKEIEKWKAGDNPVYALCVIDDKNLLSSSTSILWWNIKEKSVIKKFNCYSAEIFKLLPVNADSLNSCYFLSAAAKDIKINAWSLSSNKCEFPVASFVLSVHPKDIDISKVSSKDKSLILLAVTEDGFLHLFEHTLNGNVNEPIEPKVSFEINPQTRDFSIISVKLSSDSESCIVAYGSSKSDFTFKHIKIKELLKMDDVEDNISNKNRSPVKLPVANDVKKAEKSLPVNGLKAPSASENNPKVTHMKNASVLSSYKKKLRSSSASPVTILEKSNLEKDVAHNHINHEKVDLNDPKSSVDVLLNAINTQNDQIIEVILHKSDTEYINAFVNSLPSSCLKVVIDEITHRLHRKYSWELSRWLKEILRTNLKYVVQSQETLESLSEIKKYLESMNISKTVHKMAVLNGFLSIMQNSSSDESESENEETMEL